MSAPSSSVRQGEEAAFFVALFSRGSVRAWSEGLAASLLLLSPVCMLVPCLRTLLR